MPLRSLLLVAVVVLFSIPVTAQDDDDFSLSEPVWRWKYYPVTEVSMQDGKQIVRINLDMEYTRFYYSVLTMRDKKPAVTDEIKRIPIPVQGKDSLVLVRPAKPGDKGYVDIILPIKRLVFTEDDKKHKKAIEYELPADVNNKVQPGDLVKLEVENSLYNDSLLLYRLEDCRTILLSIESRPLFEQSQYWTEPAKEMEGIKIIMNALHRAGSVFMDKFKDPFVSSGPYAGKTVPQILLASTERTVIDFLNYILGYPRGVAGFSFNVAEYYMDWIGMKQPKGRYGPLKIDLEYNKWVNMAPIEINLDKGTINDKPIQQVLNNWASLFPWYDGDEKRYAKNNEDEEEDEDEKQVKEDPYYDYSLLGNSLTYYPKKKALKIILAGHNYLTYSKLKEGTPEELKQKLGAPARLIGHTSYLYSTTYGTIEFSFNAFYGTISLIYLYPVKPSAVVQAEPE